jgi:hypothetical protein
VSAPPPGPAGLAGRILLYARTARHLQPRQLAYWPLRRLQHRLPLRLTDPSPAALAGEAAALASAVIGWGPGSAERRLARAREVCAGRFVFLNDARTLDPPEWRRRYGGALWTMNLHYFDYALDLAWAFRLTGDAAFVRRFEALALGWIDGAAPAPGQPAGDAWEPYSIGRRIVNWAYALLLAGDAVDAHARRRMLESLYQQADLLSRRLEHHLQANHLQANYKGLLVAGLLLDGDRPRRWRDAGEHGLRRQLAVQVLPDGTHYERSPLYHLLVFLDYLECIALMRAAGRRIPVDSIESVRRMRAAAGVLTRADGTLHLFNDAAHGVAPPLAEISALAEQVLGEPVRHRAGALALPDAGYYAWHDPERGERIVIDCGEPGPAYQPGHAHCDLLSYELDLGGRQVVVDSGVSGYGGDPLRAYQRSTRAHNTVMIGGREQSEVWSTFRLARRASVRDAKLQARSGFRFLGAYSPYHDARCIHRRVIERQADGWRIEDRVEGAPGAPLQGFIHLHPDFQARIDGDTVIATAGTMEVSVRTFGADAVVIHRGEKEPAQGWHCPEFGVALPAPVIELRVERNDGHAFGCTVREGGR